MASVLGLFTNPVLLAPAGLGDNLGGIISTVGLPLVLIVVFYFALIRPQRKKDKEVKNMLANLKVGDRITTIGGIYGTIASIKDDIFTIAVGQDKVKMVIARWAIRALEDTPEEKQNDAL